MKKLLPSSSEINKRVLVLTESTDGAVDWVDAAELAESVGITLEQYPAWLNSMHELGAVAVSDKRAHYIKYPFFIISLVKYSSSVWLYL